jgi:type I restriction enzyme S subunit
MKQGWEIKKLGDVCDIELGKTPYRANKEFWDTEKQKNNVWLSIADLSKSENKIVYDSEEYITDEAVKISKIVKAGTLLLSFKLTLGRMAFAGRDLFTNEAIAALPIKQNIKLNKNYLYYSLSNFDWHSATQNDIKVKGKTLNKAKLKIIDIPIPPLPEQERIVSILDKAFSAIDQAKQNAEKNLKNTKELFDSYLNGIFTNKGDDWEEKPLNEIAEYFNGLTYSPKDVSGSGILVLRSSNIQNDELDFNDNVYVNLTVKDKIKVKENDILMCSRNGSKRLVGKTAKIQALEEEMTFGTFMMIIRSENHEILSWFFKSVNFKEQISQGENTMINQITRYMLDDVVISMPRNRETQIKISNHLRILQLHIKDLETIFKQKINELEELKKSILQKAFNGELV